MSPDDMIDKVTQQLEDKPWFIRVIMCNGTPVVHMSYMPDDTLIYQVDGVRINYTINASPVIHAPRYT